MFVVGASSPPSRGLLTDWLGFRLMRANPHSLHHSPGVRTFVLAGLQKNADKADIISGSLSRSGHVCMRVWLPACVSTCMVRIRTGRKKPRLKVGPAVALDSFVLTAEQNYFIPAPPL